MLQPTNIPQVLIATEFIYCMLPLMMSQPESLVHLSSQQNLDLQSILNAVATFYGQWEREYGKGCKSLEPFVHVPLA